jgi:hypothetical protein
MTPSDAPEVLHASECSELLDPMRLGRQQSSRFGGLDAGMPGYLVFRWIYVVLLGFRWF